MTRLPVTLTLALALVGCAAPRTPIQEAKAPKTPSVPNAVCAGAVECGKMWLSAQEALQGLTGLRLRLANDSRAETFAPSSRRPLAGAILKVPTGPDSFEIRPRFECYYQSNCDELSSSATDAINTVLGPGGVKP